MYVARVTLTGVSPMSQSKHYEIPKLNKETADAYEKRTWREKLHYDPNTEEVFIPPMAFKNCLSEAAKFLNKKIPGKGKSTYTKHFDSGVLVMDPMPLGMKKSEVKDEWLFLPIPGNSGGRVMKCFPLIDTGWTGTVDFHILDETVTEEIFKEVLEEAGKFIGLGRFRPKNRGYYGRFEIKKVKILKDGK